MVIILMVKTTHDVKNLKAFGSAVTSTTDSDNVTKEGQLHAEPFRVSVSAGNMVVHINCEIT